MWIPSCVLPVWPLNVVLVHKRNPTAWSIVSPRVPLISGNPALGRVYVVLG